MDITLEYKHASEVTKDEKKYLRKLQIKDIGLIWDEFRDHIDSKKCFVILAKNKKQIPIAWGLSYYDTMDHEWVFSVYVKQHYRRRRIGSKIYRKMRRKLRLPNEKIRVYRHDDKSTRFFNKLQR